MIFRKFYDDEAGIGYFILYLKRPDGSLLKLSRAFGKQILKARFLRAHLAQQLWAMRKELRSHGTTEPRQ